MSFYQNPFGQEFREGWPIDQQVLFTIGPNLNNIAEMVSFNAEPFDFSVNNIFTINFAFDPDRVAYTAIPVNVAGAIPAATRAYEVVNLLNANALFADNFTAFTKAATNLSTNLNVMIRSNRPRQNVRIYVTNGGAEIALQFNRRAQVGQLPSYFERYTVANRFIYTDSQAMLIELNPLNPVDAAIITAAGFNPLAPLTDWEMLTGRSNTHPFEKLTLDGSGRITTIIEYFAGSVVGDTARKIQMTYTGANTNPDQITTIPYTLQAGDLVIPPP